jgi:pimeloyl-ACP methyl ester carboxylesterase
MKRAIVIIGGYNSIWPFYLKMARLLEDSTGLQTIGVPLMPWHWWQAGRKEDGSHILNKVAETVAWARRKFSAKRFILVGHSAGGVIGRLYLYDEPVWGTAYAGVQHVDSLITLGSPHGTWQGVDTGWFLGDMANRKVPGAAYETVLYYPVVGRYIQGRQDGTHKEQRAFRLYRTIGGRGHVWGDGMVPVESAGLDQLQPLVLDGVAHSGKVGREWYGAAAGIIRRWWPDQISARLDRE